MRTKDFPSAAYNAWYISYNEQRVTDDICFLPQITFVLSMGAYRDQWQYKRSNAHAVYGQISLIQTKIKETIAKQFMIYNYKVGFHDANIKKR